MPLVVIVQNSINMEPLRIAVVGLGRMVSGFQLFGISSP